MRSPIALLVPLVLVLVSACSEEECFGEIWHRHRAELEACEPGDTCILVQTSICEVAINAEKEDRLRELRRSAANEGCPEPSCVGAENPRCEGGRCVSDPLQ